MAAPNPAPAAVLVDDFTLIYVLAGLLALVGLFFGLRQWLRLRSQAHNVASPKAAPPQPPAHEEAFRRLRQLAEHQADTDDKTFFVEISNIMRCLLGSSVRLRFAGADPRRAHERPRSSATTESRYQTAQDAPERSRSRQVCAIHAGAGGTDLHPQHNVRSRQATKAMLTPSFMENNERNEAWKNKEHGRARDGHVDDVRFAPCALGLDPGRDPRAPRAVAAVGKAATPSLDSHRSAPGLVAAHSLGARSLLPDALRLSAPPMVVASAPTNSEPPPVPGETEASTSSWRLIPLGPCRRPTFSPNDRMFVAKRPFRSSSAREPRIEVGLVVFAGEAVVVPTHPRLCPRGPALDGSCVGMLPDGTAIGAPLRRRSIDSEGRRKSRVIVLLTMATTTQAPSRLNQTAEMAKGSRIQSLYDSDWSRRSGSLSNRQDILAAS